MFLSGADGQPPELRPLGGGQWMGIWALKDKKDEQGNLIKGLKTLESEIFGGTEPAQRSRVIITCPTKNNFLKPSVIKNFPKYTENYPLSRNVSVNILNYLAYGTYDHKERRFIHDFFDERQKFDICLKFIDKTKIDEVVKAFVLMCYVGGLGSKSRNGFGKIKIISAIEMKDNHTIDITQNLPKWKKLLKTTNSKSKFTSLSNLELLFSAKEVTKGFKKWVFF